METDTELGGHLAHEHQAEIIGEVRQMTQTGADPTWELGEKGATDTVVRYGESGQNPEHQIGGDRNQVGHEFGSARIDTEHLCGCGGAA